VTERLERKNVIRVCQSDHTMKRCIGCGCYVLGKWEWLSSQDRRINKY